MQRLARNVSRLPYQLRGGSLWQLRDGTPFNEPKNNKNIGLTGGGGHSALVMKLNNGIAYTNGDSGGWCLWVQGWPALRIGFTMKKAVDDNNFAFELNTGNGPSGALTQEHTFTWGAGNPDGSQKDYTITAQNLNDLLEVGLVCTGNNTPSNPEKFAVSDIRVNCIDTTSDDGDWDTFWTSEVVADVFRRAGIDDSFVEHSGVNALPLDWTGAWTDLCTQMMEMDDWVWGVIEPPTGSHAFGGGFYRPWGDGGDRLWTVTLGAGGDESLDYLPLYNRVSVQYECPPGVDQTYTLDASPDPLAGTRAGGSVREWPEPIQLPDPTPDGALAQLVAQIWINKVSSLRAIGEVTFARVFSESGERSPYDVLAGDLCSVAELAASTPFGGQGLPPQRIVSTRYTPTEVTAEFEDSLDPSTLILEAEGRHPHRHHGQHHRRRHH